MKAGVIGTVAIALLAAIAGPGFAQQPGPQPNAEGGTNPAATDPATGKPINLNYRIVCTDGQAWIYFYRTAGGTAQQFPPQPLPPNMPNPCKRS